MESLGIRLRSVPRRTHDTHRSAQRKVLRKGGTRCPGGPQRRVKAHLHRVKGETKGWTQN